MHKSEIERVEEYYVEQIKEFKEKNGNWPKAQEISALGRNIQRKFGGLVAFRKKHNLGIEDYTKGDYRADVARAANFKASVDETAVLEFLSNKYGRVNVHEHPRIYSNTFHSADFCVYKNNKQKFFVDVFYSKDLYSLKGCMGIKTRKYDPFVDFLIYIVQLNPDITDKMIQDILSNKKKSFNQNIKVVSLDKFKKLINVV